MLLGVGIDILSLTRFQALITRRSPQKLAKRICSPTEYKRYQALSPSSTSNQEILRFLSTRQVQLHIPRIGLMHRWVLKEAAYKALSAHVPLTWKSLEVDNLPSGQPTIRYSPDDTTTGRSTSMVGMELDLMCTLSHDAGVVVGVVIAQTKT
jgi:holo-[acyl-carrier protein] synthase